MEIEEYKKRLADIDREASKKKELVHIAYADSNNPYKKGDILEDHFQIVEVAEIGYSMTSRGLCSCTYRGRKLTKKLKPFKSGEFTTMWGSNVKRKLN